MRGSPGLAHPFTPRSVRVGGRWAQLPVSGWGAFSFHCVCLSFPGVPFQVRGRACLGDPSPPNPPSLCLFAVCSRFGALTLILTVNVNRPIHRVLLDTHTCVCPFCSPHPASGRSPNCCCYQRQNKHTWVSLSLGLLSSLGLGSWARVRQGHWLGDLCHT